MAVGVTVCAADNNRCPELVSKNNVLRQLNVFFFNRLKYVIGTFDRLS